MNSLLSTLMFLYPIVCVVVPCAVYQLVCCKKDTTSALTGKINKWNLLWRYIFIIYLYMVMEVVGMGSVWDIGKFGSIIRPDEINLLPFQSEGSITYILNVIMLMPLGFLLPLLWGKYRTISRTVIIGFTFSLTIEIGQLFNRRVSDIDDLIMNTIGTVLGFCIWLLFSRIFKTKSRDTSIFRDSPWAYVLLSVMGTFFLFNWRWLLRFAE